MGQARVKDDLQLSLRLSSGGHSKGREIPGGVPALQSEQLSLCG